jgi:hypothetical protein
MQVCQKNIRQSYCDSWLSWGQFRPYFIYQVFSLPTASRSTVKLLSTSPKWLCILYPESPAAGWRELPPVRAVQALGGGEDSLLYPSGRKLPAPLLPCQLPKVSLSLISYAFSLFLLFYLFVLWFCPTHCVTHVLLIFLSVYFSLYPPLSALFSLPPS